MGLFSEKSDFKCASIKHIRVIPKNTIDHNFFRLKNPSTGTNRPKIKTTKIQETKSIFKPRPTGNILINGAIIVRTGNVKSANKIRLVFFCLIKTNKVINPKKTGIIKKLAPGNTKATTVQITSQKNKGATNKLAVFTGL